MKTEEPAAQDEAPQLPQLSQLDLQHLPSVPLHEIKTRRISKSNTGKKQRKCALDTLFGGVFITKVKKTASLYDRVHDELNNYIQEPVLPLASPPLLKWKANFHTISLLARTAKCILCVPSISVPSERVFSTVRDIVLAQRASLSPENVDIKSSLRKTVRLTEESISNVTDCQ